jgi:hypothetical protein
MSYSGSYSGTDPGTDPGSSAGQTLKLALFWAFVGIPLLWGVAETIAKATAMFR